MNLVNGSIFMCDLEGRITYWNQGAQRIYGWTKEEVLGQVAHDLLKTKSLQSLDEIRAQFWRQKTGKANSCTPGGLS